MSRVVLTLFCSLHDSETIAEAMRDALILPVHVRREAVLGRDFEDAGTGEQVAGALDRVAVEAELRADQVEEALAAATSARRRLPFRWRTVTVHDGGRVQ